MIPCSSLRERDRLRTHYFFSSIVLAPQDRPGQAITCAVSEARKCVFFAVRNQADFY